MCRCKDQSINENRVQDPKEVMETVGMKTCTRVTTASLRGQGKRCAEEIDVVPLIRLPYPVVVVNVFCEIDKYACKFAERICDLDEANHTQRHVACPRALAEAVAGSAEDTNHLVLGIPGGGMRSKS